MGSVPGLAHLARVSVDECEVALNKFMQPDPYSRTLTAEGRRIEKIDGGWLLINHSKYRRMASKDDMKERNAERQSRFRKRHRDSNESNASVTQDRDIADTDTDTKGREDSESAPARKTKGSAHGRGTRLPEDWQPTQALADFARDQGLDPEETRERFRDYWIAQPSQRGCKLDWEATWRNWCRNNSGRFNGSRQGIRSSSGSEDIGTFARAAARMGGDKPVR